MSSINRKEHSVMALTSTERISAFTALRYGENDHCLKTTKSNISAVNKYLISNYINPCDCDIEQALNILKVTAYQ